MQPIADLILKSAPSASFSEPLTIRDRMQEHADSYNATVGTLDADDGYRCERCKNRGNTMVIIDGPCEDAPPVETVVTCSCMKTRQALRRMARAGFRNVIDRYTFASYLTDEDWQRIIRDSAKRFCEDTANNWFFIGGQSGAGKSHVCTAITAHYIRQGADAEYMLWQEDIDRIKAAATDGAELERLMKRLKTVPVLYIDDLFKCGEGSGARENQFSQADIRRTFEILNSRYLNPQLVTIISSEKSAEELVRIDQALAGRIVERASNGGRLPYFISIGPDVKKNWRLKGVISL